jgi:hypothetical protein
VDAGVDPEGIPRFEAMNSKGRTRAAENARMGANDLHFTLAALQHNPGTIVATVGPSFETAVPRMTPPKTVEMFIQGVTLDGKTFRPSDWAERLAGAMSCFRPEGAAGGIGSFIGYSPYCVPRVINGVKCVIVNEKLRNIEPMAWDFVMHFARDNALQVADACLLPDPGSRT